MEGSILVHDLRKVITLVDLLRDIGLDKKLSLPKVVVLGNQSSGKSSLLEQIVGLDFLPRGSGVVTRRPLELRLNNIPGLAKPYAEFDEVLQGNTKKRFTDFNVVRETINDVTDKVCGKQKAIVDKPIVLNIFSGSCPNLTIVDLPGITSIPVGNQPKNIWEITRDMAHRYIKQKRCIILCVIPANQDLSTSQALKVLRQIDPSGERSIGCLTKIDIMDRGVDAAKILKNQQIPLRYGYVGIKNRSQQDINNKVPVSESLKTERKYFTTSPIYSTLPPDTFGTESLTHKLTHILYNQIKSSMPQIFEQIKKKRQQSQEELEKLGPGVASTDAEMVNYAWKSISSFMRIFKNSINGIKSVDYSYDPISSQIRSELNQIYKEQYEDPATEQLRDSDIEKAMINFPGDSIPGFPSIDAFLALLNPLLKKLQAPAFSINNRIHEIMEGEVNRIIDNIMIKKFPDFNYRFGDLVKRVLEKHRKELETYLNFLLDSELNYLYTNDVNYLMGDFGLTQKEKKKMETGKVRDPLIFELRKRIDSYHKLAVRNLRDLVPKQVFNFLIVKCLKEMEFEAFQFTSDINRLKELLNQPSEVRNRRLDCQKAIKIFEESQKKIRMDPQISRLIRDNKKQSKFYKKFGMKSPEEQEEAKRKQQQAKMMKIMSETSGSGNKPPSGGQSGSGGQKTVQPQQQPSNTSTQKKQDDQTSGSSSSSSNKAAQNLFGNVGNGLVKKQSLPNTNPNQQVLNPNPNSNPNPNLVLNTPPTERRNTTNPNPMMKNLFGDQPGTDPNQKTNVPTMQKQQNPGTGTATTGKTNNFANMWDDEASNPKKQQPKTEPKAADKPVDNKAPPPPEQKKRMTFNNLFGVK